MVLANLYSRAPPGPVPIVVRPVTRLGRMHLKRSNRLILLIGVFLAIVAFVGIVVVFQGDRGGGGAQTPAELPTVFASRGIALGTPITKDMLTSKNIPVTQRDGTAFPDPSLLYGKIARQDIAAGKQLTARDFDSGVAGGLLSVNTPPAWSRSPSRSTRCRAWARSFGRATTSTSSSASRATSSRS